MRSERRCLALGLVVLTLSGCVRSRLERSVADEYGSTETELEFWAELENQPLVTTHDALHGLWLLAEGEDDRQGFLDRSSDAANAGWWPSRSQDANEAVRIGTVAVALWELLDLPESLVTHLIGPTPRESLRALQRRGLLPPRSRDQAISGSEFVDLIARAADQLEASEVRGDDGEGDS